MAALFSSYFNSDRNWALFGTCIRIKFGKGKALQSYRCLFFGICMRGWSVTNLACSGNCIIFFLSEITSPV